MMYPFENRPRRDAIPIEEAMPVAAGRLIHWRHDVLVSPDLLSLLRWAARPARGRGLGVIRRPTVGPANALPSHWTDQKPVWAAVTSSGDYRQAPTLPHKPAATPLNPRLTRRNCTYARIGGASLTTTHIPPSETSLQIPEMPTGSPCSPLQP